MSAKTVGKVWELALTPAKQTVLLALADHADHEGNNAFPSVDLIAWKTGYSERQVRRIMKELEADSLLVRTGGAPGKRIVYSINLSAGKHKPDFVPRKRGNDGQRLDDHKIGIMFQLAARQGMTCHYCGVELTAPSQHCATMPTLDHVVAKKNGGTDELSNLVLCCSRCNSRKGSKRSHDEYYEMTRLEREARHPVTTSNDKMSNDKMPIGQDVHRTLQAKSVSQTSDIASADLSHNHPQDQPSVVVVEESTTTTTRISRVEENDTPPPSQAETDAWDAVFHQLEMQLDRDSFDAWLRGAALLGVEARDDGSRMLVIGARHAYARDMLQGRLYRSIHRVLSDVGTGFVGVPLDVRFEVLDTLPESAEPDAAMPLFRLLAQDDARDPAGAPRQPAAEETETVRALFERFIGPVTDANEASVAFLEQHYDAASVGHALTVMAAAQARGRVRDPLGYTLGILHNQQSNGS
jgi:5-methylcytosine-specific restriction endonuclease McrA